ncbi:ATP-binding cassette domain-containing protein [Abyssisolibacter fermentans]|uniref:ATP-binding cassette domain-containing protein n=1 Tax=Abyssisolibacter fermentans TaxID=1766203 RepID=UPI0023DD72B9|nr:ATP-binding cassette domain-containing protein [Abyssisolibacter fermentans]
MSFDIEKHEIVGFVGLNGAGKTTTIKMLSEILTPTSGQITTNGYIPYKSRNKLSMYIAVSLLHNPKIRVSEVFNYIMY